jgi:hypothetical protein
MTSKISSWATWRHGTCPPLVRLVAVGIEIAFIGRHCLRRLVSNLALFGLGYYVRPFLHCKRLPYSVSSTHVQLMQVITREQNLREHTKEERAHRAEQREQEADKREEISTHFNFMIL